MLLSSPSTSCALIIIWDPVHYSGVVFKRKWSYSREWISWFLSHLTVPYNLGAPQFTGMDCMASSGKVTAGGVSFLIKIGVQRSAVSNSKVKVIGAVIRFHIWSMLSGWRILTEWFFLCVVYTFTDEVCDGVLYSFCLTAVSWNVDQSINLKQSCRSLFVSSKQHSTTFCIGSSCFTYCF